MFYDYLITNILLYFDKFEDELQPKLPDTTTPEYEANKGAEKKPDDEAPEETDSDEEDTSNEEDTGEDPFAGI